MSACLSSDQLVEDVQLNRFPDLRRCETPVSLITANNVVAVVDTEDIRKATVTMCSQVDCWMQNSHDKKSSEFLSTSY